MYNCTGVHLYRCTGVHHTCACDTCASTWRSTGMYAAQACRVLHTSTVHCVPRALPRAAALVVVVLRAHWRRRGAGVGSGCREVGFDPPKKKKKQPFSRENERSTRSRSPPPRQFKPGCLQCGPVRTYVRTFVRSFVLYVVMNMMYDGLHTCAVVVHYLHTYIQCMYISVCRDDDCFIIAWRHARKHTHSSRRLNAQNQ